MHSFKDAARTWSSRGHSNCANHFSFPPTQRLGLLRSTSDPHRSTDQRVNLNRSFERMLDCLMPSASVGSPA